MKRRRRVLFHVERWALCAAVALTIGGPARAEDDPTSRVQVNAGLDLGLVGQGHGTFWQASHLFFGARGDVLFGRHGEGTWGVGPTIGVGTYRFRDVSGQAGLSVLVPVHEYLPIVLSAGPYVGHEARTEVGAFGTLFWGTRSFNYQSSYDMVAGLLVEPRVGFGPEKERSIVLALHIDGEILALPVLLFVNAFRLPESPVQGQFIPPGHLHDGLLAAHSVQSTASS